MITPENLIADCGCILNSRMGPDGEVIVTLIPHDPDCETAKQAIAFAESQGKPVTTTGKGIKGTHPDLVILDEATDG